MSQGSFAALMDSEVSRIRSRLEWAEWVLAFGSREEKDAFARAEGFADWAAYLAGPAEGEACPCCGQVTT